MQTAVNIFDATTDAHGDNLPTVFSPVFRQSTIGGVTNLFIIGYTEITGYFDGTNNIGRYLRTFQNPQDHRRVEIFHSKGGYGWRLVGCLGEEYARGWARVSGLAERCQSWPFKRDPPLRDAYSIQKEGFNGIQDFVNYRQTGQGKKMEIEEGRRALKEALEEKRPGGGTLSYGQFW